MKTENTLMFPERCKGHPYSSYEYGGTVLFARQLNLVQIS